MTAAGPQFNLLHRFLDTNGDGSGNKDAIGNYLATPTDFYLQPPAGYIYRISRIIVSVEDTTVMQAQEYGNLGGPLTNGIAIKYTRNDEEIFLTDDHTIKTNADWGAFAFDVDIKAWGAGNEFLVTRWTFSKSGQFVRLVGNAGDKLVASLSDNFTGLINHHFLAQGYVERSGK